MKMKALAIIYYITNHVIKDDYSQYQYIILITIVKKSYKDTWLKAIAIDSLLSITDNNLNKFALQTFNK